MEPHSAEQLSALIAHIPSVIDGIIKARRSHWNHLCWKREDVQEGQSRRRSGAREPRRTKGGDQQKMDSFVSGLFCQRRLPTLWEGGRSATFASVFTCVSLRSLKGQTRRASGRSDTRTETTAIVLLPPCSEEEVSAETGAVVLTWTLTQNHFSWSAALGFPSETPLLRWHDPVIRVWGAEPLANESQAGKTTAQKRKQSWRKGSSWPP